jgi:hypothetical protein
VLYWERKFSHAKAQHQYLKRVAYELRTTTQHAKIKMVADIRITLPRNAEVWYPARDIWHLPTMSHIILAELPCFETFEELVVEIYRGTVFVRDLRENPKHGRECPFRAGLTRYLPSNDFWTIRKQDTRMEVSVGDPGEPRDIQVTRDSGSWNINPGRETVGDMGKLYVENPRQMSAENTVSSFI